MPPATLAVHGEYTVRGHRRASVHVHPAGVVWIRGTLDGSLSIEPGGTAHVFGAVLGSVRNEGRLILGGAARGEIRAVGNGQLLDHRPAAVEVT